MYKNSLLHACVLVPKFDEFNNPYTVVYHANGVKEIIKQTPDQLLDRELKEYGSSLKGAKEAARSMLPPTTMYPILIPRRGFIPVWFSSESARNEKHIYFAIHAVVSIEVVTKESCMVVLRNGEKIEAPVSKRRLNHRINHARNYFAIFILNQYENRYSYPGVADKFMWRSAEFLEDYVTT